ncbi:MAG TPA: riboflavin synthase [Geminicoccaceae bacterium]|nr:riboflavin synthase [Geminicoccaceae bacterium]
MFTGIVTHIGRVAAVAGEDGRELVIETDMAPEGLALGASVSHSGVCLTLVERLPGGWRVQASGETLARTTLGDWRAGTAVNLERSLRLGDELGGHLVFGHVDAVGELLAVEPEGESRRLVFRLPPELAPMLAVKGSIAVDGISLTVNAVEADRFEVTIVPHTWRHTTLQDRRPGDRVNLEADMLARYVARQLAVRPGA